MNRNKLLGILLLLLIILIMLCTWCHIDKVVQKQMSLRYNSTPRNEVNISHENNDVQLKQKALHRVMVKKDTKVQEEARVIQEKIQTLLSLEHMHFKSNSSTITDKSEEMLYKISKLLKGHPHQLVEIEGHTDNSGNNDLNLKLSQERVDSVKKALIHLGINAQRLEAIGYGATEPLVSNDTKENRQINRRVEFKIIGE